MHYKLEGRKVVEVPGLLVWARWFEKSQKKRIVKQTQITRQKLLSTVFLGLDHGWGNTKKPVLFETMLFVRGKGKIVERYCTYTKAENGHKVWLRYYNSRLKT